MASAHEVTEVITAFKKLDEYDKCYVAGIMQGILLSKDRKQSPTPASKKKAS